MELSAHTCISNGIQSKTIGAHIPTRQGHYISQTMSHELLPVEGQLHSSTNYQRTSVQVN